MSDFYVGSKVRIKYFGDLEGNGTDDGLKGVVGEVIAFETRYLRVSIPEKHLGLYSVLCFPEELEVISE